MKAIFLLALLAFAPLFRAQYILEEKNRINPKGRIKQIDQNLFKVKTEGAAIKRGAVITEYVSGSIAYPVLTEEKNLYKFDSTGNLSYWLNEDNLMGDKKEFYAEYGKDGSLKSYKTKKLTTDTSYKWQVYATRMMRIAACNRKRDALETAWKGIGKTIFMMEPEH